MARIIMCGSFKGGVGKTASSWNLAYSLAETGKKVYTLGPIIHNEQVVQDLEQKGVRVIDTPEELSEAEDATVIIRSHGISADVYHQLEDKKVRIVDATCPFVSKIHRIVEKKYQQCWLFFFIKARII